MKRTTAITAMLAGALVIGGSLTARETTQQPTPMNDQERVGYAVGYDLGLKTLEQISIDGVDVDLPSFIRGLGDAMLEKDPRMTGGEIFATLADLEREVNERLAQARLSEDPAFKLVHDENMRRSREFHTNFGGKDGVVTLDSGVQYQVLTASSGGDSATIEDTVEITYKGQTLSGNAVGEGGTIQVPVETMLRGGREVMQMMRPGDHWLVAIPPSMGHGSAGKAPEIGPGETVVFEVTLERVIKE